MRSVALSLIVAATCAGCRASVTAPSSVERVVERSGRSPVTVRLTLQAEHRALERRFLDAAEASIRALEGWAPSGSAVVLIDPPYHGTPATPDDAILLPRTPWWSAPTAMAPELAVARGMTRRALTRAIDVQRLPGWFVDGLTEYLSRQSVIGLFARENTAPGYAMLELRHFGGFVPQFLRIRLLPEADGEPLRAFRSAPSAGPATGNTRALAGKTVAALATLERWLGPPVLDEVIVQFVQQQRGRPPTLTDFARVASDASGQDLSWLLAPALDSPAVYDYGVADLSSRPIGGDGYETRVSVARLGDGLFTGAAAPRVGRYESGKGVTLVITFADGRQIRESWDGRDTRKAYVYKSAAPAASATVDPDRLLALDMKRTNNSLAMDPFTTTASVAWSARWMLWLEHWLLTGASLV